MSEQTTTEPRATSRGIPYGGTTAPGFEELEEVFRENLDERGELGAACAVCHEGELVVDLWGGYRDHGAGEPWREDTLIFFFSTTKGVAATTLALAHSRGLLDYEERVATYWPEFAQNGKERITVRQLISHEAGLLDLDERLDMADLADHERLATVLARARPRWEPGRVQAYHAITVGLYMGALLRRVDPEGRSLGTFFREEIARPLGLELHIGLPPEVPAERLPHTEMLNLVDGARNLGKVPFGLLRRVLWPLSLFHVSHKPPLGFDPNDRTTQAVEFPSGNGMGEARALARLYGELALGGGRLGLSEETFETITAPACLPPGQTIDPVTGMVNYFTLGFYRPGPSRLYGSGERCLGFGGLGGSLAFADPDRRLGFAYGMTSLDYYPRDNPREKSMRDAMYRCVERLGPRPELAAAATAAPAQAGGSSSFGSAAGR